MISTADNNYMNMKKNFNAHAWKDIQSLLQINYRTVELMNTPQVSNNNK